MSPSDHPDFDALSGFVDGEAPEWADHVASCEACRAAAAELRALAVAIGRPVDPPRAAVREAAIAAALGAMAPAPTPAPTPVGAVSPGLGHDAERARFAGRAGSRNWALGAVAAVVLAVVGLSGVLLAGTRSSDHLTTVAGPAPESGKAQDSLSAAAPQIPVTDLGDIPDPATLRSRATGLLAPTAAASSTGRSASATNSGNTGNALTGPPTAVSGNSGVSGGGSVAASASAGSGGVGGTGGAGALPAPAVVGTRPCEEQARAREPGLGLVAYFAVARQGSVPAYVLGFTPPGGVSPLTLLLLAQDGCRELVRSAGP